MPKKITTKKRKAVKRTSKSKAPAMLSVISVRISDEEKERIDEIMRCNNISRYADVLHQAIKMVKVPQQAA
jgi:hypothetical protein